MYIYIVTFLISCSLLYIGEKYQKNKLLSYTFIVLGLLLPCTLAGLRNETIGTDVQVYVRPMFEAAINTDKFIDYFNSSWLVIWRYKYV